MPTPPAEPLWTPDPARVRETAMARFFAECAGGAGDRAAEGTVGSPSAVPPADAPFAAWHRWSCEQPAAFWSALWRFAGVIADETAGSDPWDSVVDGFERMSPPDKTHGPRWFRGARLNFAENLLKHRGAAIAIVSRDERGARRELSRDELAEAVARFAGALRAQGIQPGDRVAGFLPNIPEAVIAMLGAASIGAVWSSCSPDFGVKGVLDRFGQIEPRVLVVADGYRYAGKEIDCLDRVREIVEAIPSIERVVVVPFLRAAIADAVLPHTLKSESFEKFSARGDGTPLAFKRLPFDHPLYVMYSSGTTGLPKCMVHGAGGTLLQHLKEHQLHTDIREHDRVFYFTTCGWMMWNWLVSALASGATIVLYDGAPMPAAAPDALWALAAAERVTAFGVSAKFLALSEKSGLKPASTVDLTELRCILSTGSPLAATSFEYVYREVKRDVHLASISGGTDIISCFVLGSPLLPVWAGELQCAGLGMAVDVWNEAGESVRGAAGELVCTRPFPSMPIAFWNDEDGAKYRAAYFSEFANCWRHGDWAIRTEHDGFIITGRSDATLNPGGVRIGTAEIYRQVELLDEVIESIVVPQEIRVDGAPDVRIVLFVRLRPGVTLDLALQERIRAQIRSNTSPHHVPRLIYQVDDIPRTISGKLSESAVLAAIHGRTVKNTDALANPQSLEIYKVLAELLASLGG